MVVVVLLLMVDLILVGMVLGGARDQDLTARRVETVQAFYAAESGLHMAARELGNNTDEDGDGGVGSISDDGNAANDPAIGVASVFTTLTPSGANQLLASQGRSGEAVRDIEAIVE